MSTKRIAIAGLGLIGKERLRAVDALRARGRDVVVTAALDPAPPNGVDVRTVASFEELISDRPDMVIVATPNDVAVDLASKALAQGIDVLVEKPLGRSAEEAEKLVKRAHDANAKLYVGFNYRFQPGIRRLLLDARAGAFGVLVSMKTVLGHGGAPNMGDTWKLDKDKIGGGCLLDPGIHVLDLARVVAKTEPKVVGAMAWRGFWKKGLDEEAHVVLDGGGFPINIDVSLVRWRSTFAFEVHGTEGYGIVTGRNRSYGPQRYVRGERWGWRGGKSQRDSETVVLETEGDDSFIEELDAVLFPDASTPLGPCDASEGLAVMRLYDRIAESAR